MKPITRVLSCSLEAGARGWTSYTVPTQRRNSPIPSRYKSNSFMEKSDMADKNADRKGPNGLITLVGIAIASFLSALLMIGAFNPHPHANQINSELSKKLGLSGSAG